MRETLRREADRIQVSLSEEQVERLARYVELLVRDGDLLGLTSLREEEDILRELVLDPLHGLEFFEEGARVLDVGSGGGCPGVALAVARPDLRVDLLEVKQRKAGFLSRTLAELELSGEVLVERCETLGQQPAYRERYRHATAKALAAVPVLLELTLPFVEVGGSLVAYKGPGLGAELEAAGQALRTLGGTVATLRPYDLGDKRYQLCVIRKIAPTPREYPRRAGTPARSPL